MATKIVEKFLTIIPRSQEYTRYESLYDRTITYNVEPIPLNVIRDSGVSYTPDVKITVNDLNSGKKQFLNNSGQGDSFKVDVIIKNGTTFHAEGDMKISTNYTPNGTIDSIHLTRDFDVLTVLDYWIRSMTVFIVTTRAVDIQNGEYIITGNPSRKQTYENYTVWELEFTKYTGPVIVSANANSTYVNKAIKTYNTNKSNAAKKKASTTKAKKSSTSNNKFSKCKLSVLVYSKKQKKVDCVLQMQKKLQKLGYYKSTLDGWYYNKTVDAVKQFQKKKKLQQTGKVNQKTFDALCKV